MIWGGGGPEEIKKASLQEKNLEVASLKKLWEASLEKKQIYWKQFQGENFNFQKFLRPPSRSLMVDH